MRSAEHGPMLMTTRDEEGWSWTVLEVHVLWGSSKRTEKENKMNHAVKAWSVITAEDKGTM
jgi:hypothetical protein